MLLPAQPNPTQKQAHTGTISLFRHLVAASNGRGVLVVGSVNMDVTAEVSRLPLKGETTLSTNPSISLAVGGKVRRPQGKRPFFHFVVLCCAGQATAANCALPHAAGSQPGSRGRPPQQQQ